MSDTMVRPVELPAELQDPTGVAAAKLWAREHAQGALRSVALRVFAAQGEAMAKLMSSRAQADPYPVYEQIRRLGLLTRGKRIPLWIAARHDVCYTLTRDGRFGVDNRNLPDYQTPPDDSVFAKLPRDHEMILRMDPPDHTRVRRLVSRAFTPRAVQALRPRIEQIAHDLLDRTASAGEMDLVEDYAVELPILVICEMLGVPAGQRRQFREWGDAVTQNLGLNVSAGERRRADRAGWHLYMYLEELCDEHRANPRDDILSALLAAEDDGDKLTHRELLATLFLLLLAGFETTVNLISNGTTALMANRDQLEDLRDNPDIATNAVDELLRFDSPVQFTARNVLAETHAFGQTLKAGEQVAILLGAANNDPDMFDNPRRLDLRRPNASMHLAFSSGPHYCLGAALARMEGEVAFNVLLQRCADLRAAGKSVRRPNELLRGYSRLPVAFRAR